ncbi:TPA: Shiga toxin A subunit [Citrobacter amalonaticus]
MIRAGLLMLAVTPVCVFATTPGSECATRGRYVEQRLFSAITNDLGIDPTAIARGKTSSEILSITPVSEVFARQMAKTDSVAGNGLSENEYFSIYHDKHAMNLTVQYTYTSTEGKKDVFIVSALLNDDECSIRHNGYLTISREF